MPPTDSTNDDEAFLTLLSAQRELLNQMNIERMQEREQQQRLLQQTNGQEFQRHRFQQEMMQQYDQQQQLSQYSENESWPPGFSNHPSQYTINTTPNDKSTCHKVDPFSLMNQPIINRRSSMDYLYATRRLSMGMGIVVGKDSFTPSEVEYDEWIDLKETEEEPSQEHCSVKRKAQRRRSSLGIVAALMHDDLKMSAARRLSLVSTFSRSLMDSSINGEEDAVSLTLDESTIAPIDQEDELSQGHPHTANVESTSTAIDQCNSRRAETKFSCLRLDPSVDLPTLTMMMNMFTAAMDSSAKSQQDIHDWDRKMGLKRSHSKTMRLSMRSRKKLRAVINKEIATIKSFG
jgi:hypothetical protein